jgi:DNA polymerase V
MEITIVNKKVNDRGIPLYLDAIKAGFPSPAGDFVDTKLDLQTFLIKHPEATFFARVSGDSMIGAGIVPNDILVIDRSIKPRTGLTIVAEINGEFTVKRLGITKEGIELIPENSNYRNIKIKEGDSFQIWGVVTGVVRKMEIT